MKCWSLFASAILFTLFTSTSHALPSVTLSPCVNYPSSSCATGITDLEVMGMLFDVMFSQLSFNDLFASTDPYFWGDPVGAAAAAEAIAATLNDSVIGVAGYVHSYIYIPYDTDNTSSNPLILTEALIEMPFFSWIPIGTHITSPYAVPSDWSPPYYDSYALFTKQCVDCPAPATLTLFGMGLMGIVLSRSKRDPRLQST